MPWSTSTRAHRLPARWAAIRTSILNRDQHQCQIQGTHCTRTATEVDHIRAGDNHHPTNLQAVCATCHRAKTRAEAQAAKPSRTRTPEHHPGITTPGD